MSGLLFLAFRAFFPPLLFPALFSATCFQRAILSVYAVDI